MSKYKIRSPVGATVVGGTATVAGLLPMFLVGALAVQLTMDLAFGAVGLGIAVAAFRASGAATAPLLGPLADRLGAARSIRVATSVSSITAIGVATTATSLVTLTAWLIVAGGAHSLVQPAANRLLLKVVQPERLGLAFGFKQSAPPAASMLAGASVPLVALTVGWRWTFALGAVVALTVLIGAGPLPPRIDVRAKRAILREPLENRRLIVLLAIAFGFGTSTNAATTTFFVAAAVHSGNSQTFAAAVLAVGSIAAIASRVGFGLLSDHMLTGHLRVCSSLLGAGAVGLVLIGFGKPPWMAAGLIIAFAGVWGFNGIFWFALVRAYPRMPGRITGALTPGALVGSTIGPILFGVIVQGPGYRVAWLLSALIALVGAVAMFIGNTQLERARDVAGMGR